MGVNGNREWEEASWVSPWDKWDRKHKVGIGLQGQKRGERRAFVNDNRGHSVREHRRKRAGGMEGDGTKRDSGKQKGPVIRCGIQWGRAHTTHSSQKESQKPYVYISQSYTAASEYNPHLSSPTLESTTSPRSVAPNRLYTSYRTAPDKGGRDGVSCETFSPSCCHPSSFVYAELSVSRRSRPRTGTLPFSLQASKSANRGRLV